MRKIYYCSSFICFYLVISFVCYFLVLSPVLANNVSVSVSATNGGGSCYTSVTASDPTSAQNVIPCFQKYFTSPSVNGSCNIPDGRRYCISALGYSAPSVLRAGAGPVCVTTPYFAPVSLRLNFPAGACGGGGGGGATSTPRPTNTPTPRTGCYADRAQTQSGFCISNFGSPPLVCSQAGFGSCLNNERCCAVRGQAPTATQRPTQPPTRTPTPTRRSTPTPTRRITDTPTRRPTPTPTRRVGATNTNTLTPTRTRTGTPTPTRRATATPTTRACVISCTVNLNPSSSTVAPGNNQQFEAVMNSISPCGNPVQVNFTSSNPGAAGISPSNDSTARYQTVATVPAGANSGDQSTITANVLIGGVVRCTDTSRVTVGAQSCSFDLIPNSATTGISGTTNLQVSNITQSGTIDSIDFSSSDSSIVTVNPGSDSSPTYRTTATGVGMGTATVTADMIMGGSSVCSSSSDINVTAATQWWQVQGSDVMTNGNITSDIPASCNSAAACDNSLIIYNSSESPGVAAASGTIDTGTGQISQNSPPYGWQASAGYNGPRYGYDYFEEKATCGTFDELSDPRIDSLSDLTSGSASNGYYWVRYSGGGTLTIDSDINLGNNKVVLFVKNGDLIINGKVSFNDGAGFFMTVTKNNIIVDPSVGGPAGGAPDLEGIYFADEQFRSGTNGPNLDQQLHVRGSVVAFDKLILQRSLVDNSTTPAEFFEYAPELLFQFPECLGERNVQWRELAP